ncbi:hypothetical protein LCGC14_3094000, partial [marine sediment metagenome]
WKNDYPYRVEHLANLVAPDEINRHNSKFISTVE